MCLQTLKASMLPVHTWRRPFVLRERYPLFHQVRTCTVIGKCVLRALVLW